MSVAAAGLPRHRPSRIVRFVVGVAGLGALAFAAVLMLADRAPGVLYAAFGDAAQRLWDRVDAPMRAPLREAMPVGGRPGADDVVHVVVWATVAALCALTVWTWRGLLFAGAACLLTSLLVELAQGRWSVTREVERSDIAANALGVVAGTIIAALAMALGDVIGRWRSSGELRG